MKKLFALLAFILTVCPVLSACGEVKFPTASPDALNTSAATTPSPTVTPVVTPEPSDEGDEVEDEDLEKIHADLQKYYSWEIEEAKKYRVKVGDTEYYFETSIFLETYPCNEFPLYKLKDGSWPEYLGTTGFAFQVFNGYIYIQSDMLQEDWPDGTMTRVVNLKDLSVTPLGRNKSIFIPKQGSNVYYTSVGAGYIYIADASLKHPKELDIAVPNKDIIEHKIGLSVDDVCTIIDITDVKDGWIYFSYWLGYPEGPSYYEGNYRVKTNGSKTEKIGEGQFGDEEASED